MGLNDARRQLREGGRQERARIADPEFRENQDGSFTISGYASTTDAPYEVTDFLGSYTETITRGAFAKSLREADDVRLLVNHDGIPLARTRSGTLTLSEVTKPADDPQGRDQTGLWAEASLDAQSPLAQTVRSAMSRGDLSQMSFAFQATRQAWNEDYTERSINEVRLFDVSVVTYPANPGTSVDLNSAKVAMIAARAASGKPITDPEDLAVISELRAVLDSLEEREEEPVVVGEQGPEVVVPLSEPTEAARSFQLELDRDRAKR